MNKLADPMFPDGFDREKLTMEATKMVQNMILDADPITWDLDCHNSGETSR